MGAGGNEAKRYIYESANVVPDYRNLQLYNNIAF